MIHNRTRLITFRLSEEEYHDVRNVCAAQGARSVSAFIRMSVIWVLANWDRRVRDLLQLSSPSGEQNAVRAVGFSDAEVMESHGSLAEAPRGEQVAELRHAVGELRSEVESLTKLMQAMISGPRGDSH